MGSPGAYVIPRRPMTAPSLTSVDFHMARLRRKAFRYWAGHEARREVRRAPAFSRLTVRRPKDRAVPNLLLFTQRHDRGTAQVRLAEQRLSAASVAGG
jgi:hypothetical protein